MAAGELKFDPHQVKAVEQLQRLRNELDGYEPTSPGFMWRVSPSELMCMRYGRSCLNWYIL